MRISPRTTRQPTLRSGLTLIELTVVILVLLSLISVLFIGALSWKRGSDRAGCILNIRNVQQAVRGQQNAMEKHAGDTLDPDDIVGDRGYLTGSPACPSDGTYTLTPTYPALGEPALTCDKAASLDHTPASTTGW